LSQLFKNLCRFPEVFNPAFLLSDGDKNFPESVKVFCIALFILAGSAEFQAVNQQRYGLRCIAQADVYVCFNRKALNNLLVIIFLL
jgi:hypothetical protein